MVMRARQQKMARLLRQARSTATAVLVGVLTFAVTAAPAAAQEAETVSDADSTRTITLIVIGFVVLGLVLTGVTVWFWRSTRPDHPALAPLEVMGDRGFAERTPFEQRQLLDAVRPEGAEVLRPPVPEDGTAERSEAALDLQRMVQHTPPTFDDLIEPALAVPPERADVASPPPPPPPLPAPGTTAPTA